MTLFENKVVFITGAAAGIGKATALSMSAQGANVIVSDINETKGNETVEEIVKNGGQARFVQLDVGDVKQIEGVIMQVFAEEGKIDLAVNNAGISNNIAPIHEVTLEDWNRTVNINLTGLFFCMQAQINCMLKKGGGNIVNLASLAGLNGIPGGGPYCATKHAVIGLTKTAAMEYGPANIRVNAVCPSLIETALTKDLPKEIIYYHNQIRVPLKRMGQPNEVADAIVWLLSDKSSYINGHSLYVDGGYQAS
ncbi:MAG: NAD(P)-dependent dehydrogenase (short-subunit alcohol dehydrogenase family) [Maribacter sp.]|jgi:NAD(P)-dependent dehydrogenase (short-subunit alcohol dehydrogenase family)